MQAPVHVPTRLLRTSSNTKPSALWALISPMKLSDVIKLQEQWQGEWMKIEGVVGVAIGESSGAAYLVIYSALPKLVIEHKIPKSVQGVEIKIIETERINTHNK